MKVTALSQGLGKILFCLGLPQESLDSMQQTLADQRLRDVLNSPVISLARKENIVDALFEKETAKFVKILCKHGCIEQFDDIMDSCMGEILAAKHWMRAEIVSARPLAEVQLEKIRSALCEKYNATGVALEEKTDASLLGGFILTVGDLRCDQSVRRRIDELAQRIVRR